jgi:outer membrane protein assembly factor BamB/Tol biopolymer transport system component
MGCGPDLRLAGLVFLLTVVAMSLLTTSARAGIERVSVSSWSGEEGRGGSGVPSISADGRFVAFASGAPNLVAGDTNGRIDVFVFDRDLGRMERVSVAAAGGGPNGDSVSASISADGRSVVFDSYASDLVAGDANDARDVFVFDRESGETQRVSVSSGGAGGNRLSARGRISGDGRRVAFESDASNLVAGDTNGARDVFVFDRETRRTERVSRGASGAQGNGSSGEASISADGLQVAFASTASNLVVGDANGRGDVFVVERETGQVERVNADGAGGLGTESSSAPSLSGDGRHVAFLLGGPDPNETIRLQVFAFDRGTGLLERVSVAGAGGPANGSSFAPAISADGRRVAYESDASDLVGGDVDGARDVFLRDRWAGTTTRVSAGPAAGAAISADGRDVAFSSTVSGLAAWDANREEDVFVYGAPSVTLSSLSGPATAYVGVSGAGFVPGEGVELRVDASVVGSATAGAAGSFRNVRVRIPADAGPGLHRVRAVGVSSGRAPSGSFLVRSPWTQLAFSAAHAGTNGFEHVLGPDNVAGLTTSWSAATGTVVAQPAVIAGAYTVRRPDRGYDYVSGALYVGSDDGTLSAFDHTSGRPLWTRVMGSAIPGAPAVLANTVFAATADGTLYALDRKTGAELWRRSAGTPVHSSPTIASGTVYLQTDHGELHAFDGVTGAEHFSVAVGPSGGASPAVANGRVLVSADAQLKALDAATGGVLWSHPIGGNADNASSPAVVSGVAYVGNTAGELHAIRTSSGVPVWTRSLAATGDLSVSTPVMATGRVIARAAGRLYALRASSGAVAWSAADAAPARSVPALANGVLYSSGPRALDATTGATLWQAGAPGEGPPAIVSDGTVYAGASAFRLP